MLAFSRLCNVEICGARLFKGATDDGNLDAERITAAVETEMLVFLRSASGSAVRIYAVDRLKIAQNRTCIKAA
ncbi:hypothetical protein [Yoonia sp. MH D7]